MTSERLGREGLAAWEDRKSNTDPEVAAEAKDDGEAPANDDETAKAESEADGAEQAVADEEAQTQRGTKSQSRNVFPIILIRQKKGKRPGNMPDRVWL